MLYFLFNFLMGLIMATMTLRNLGGSVVVTLPKKMLNTMNLHAGSQVSIEALDGKLIIEPKPKPHYSLAELLAQCDLTQPLSEDENNWLNDGLMGLEEI
jgi:antitoxin ChpS